MAREYDLGEKSDIGISGAYGTIRTPAYDKWKRADVRRNRAFEEAYASPEFKRFLAELVQREDSKPIIYRDKNGILHGGTGHKLTPEEKKQYNEGDPVTQEQVDIWFEEDSRKAWSGAMDKADDIDNKALLPYLAHVDYQLGSNWHKDFEKTYRFLKEGDYASARDELELNSAGTGPSKWFADTPERVRDFQKGLETVGGFSPADQRPEQFWDYKGQQHSYEVNPEKSLAFTKVQYRDPKDYSKGSYLKDQLQSSTVQVTGGDERRIWPEYQRDVDKGTPFKTIGKKYPTTVPGTTSRAEHVGGHIQNAMLGATLDYTAPGWALKIYDNMRSRKRRKAARQDIHFKDAAKYGKNRFNIRPTRFGYVENFHNQTLEEGKEQLDSDSGKTMTVNMLGLSHPDKEDGLVYAVPGYDRDKRKPLTAGEAGKKYANLIRSGIIRGVPERRANKVHARWHETLEMDELPTMTSKIY